MTATAVAPPLPPAEVPRRRPRAWPLLVLGLAFLLAGAVQMAWSFQPLASDGVSDVRGTRSADLPTFDGGAVALLYDHREYVSYAFELRNNGPVAVTVTDIALPPQPLPLLHEVRVLLRPRDSADVSADPAGAVEFEPFTLGRSERRTIVVQARMDGCEQVTERAMSLFAAHHVRTRTLGVSRSVEVPLGVEVLVRAPTIVDCPGRPLDRSHREPY